MRTFLRRATWGGICATIIALIYCIPAALAQTADPNKTAELEAELAGINEEIRGLNSTITGLKSEGVSLDRDVKLLNANINRANLNIKAKNLQIAKLGDGIKEKTRTIGTLSERIERERQSLAQLIRKTNELDQSSLAEMMLSNEDLSDFFLDLDSFEMLRGALKNSSDVLRSARIEHEAEQEALEGRQAAEVDARADLEASKRLVQANEQEKKRLLSITKNKEKEYARVLSEREKRASEIRTALFALRDSGEIPFGVALDYANVVSAQTGVRPAFLLAIFMQESGLGKNLGACLLKNPTTGDGVGANTWRAFSRVMNPTRDVPPFLTITQKLGRDPYSTRVSCPQEIGWGGAMGAAQFIPSTWVMFENRITRALGTQYADPWNARDAFMAAGLFLSDLGADVKTYSAERDAACRYYSGKRCGQSGWAATYGTQVMSKAASIQENMINPLQNT